MFQRPGMGLNDSLIRVLSSFFATFQIDQMQLGLPSRDYFLHIESKRDLEAYHQVNPFKSAHQIFSNLSPQNLPDRNFLAECSKAESPGQKSPD